MRETEIYDKLTGIFRDVLMRDDLVLTPELTAKDVPGWDSFRQIEIIISVEDTFGIKLHPRDLDRLNAVGDLANIVVDKTRAA